MATKDSCVCRFCKKQNAVTWNARMFSWWCSACGRFDAKQKRVPREPK
jgi:hypothetical protein